MLHRGLKVFSAYTRKTRYQLLNTFNLPPSDSFTATKIERRSRRRAPAAPLVLSHAKKTETSFSDWLAMIKQICIQWELIQKRVIIRKKYSVQSTEFIHFHKPQITLGNILFCCYSAYGFVWLTRSPFGFDLMNKTTRKEGNAKIEILIFLPAKRVERWQLHVCEGACVCLSLRLRVQACVCCAIHSALFFFLLLKELPA